MGFHRSTLFTEIEHTYGDGDTCEPVTNPDLRPELLHITKTGGTTLEIVGAMYNFTWGACHWLTSVDDMGSLRCPQINVTKPLPHMDFGSIWHVPPKWMKPESKFWMENATLFSVVRDPYDRAVSSWNYNHRGNPLAFNASAMNLGLIQIVTGMDANRPVNGTKTRPSAAYFSGGMMIPQTEYITDDVRVLRTETLERDFLCMMRGHGYDWEWPKKKEFNKSNQANRLTVANLTSTTKALIAKAYREDFEQFGYQI